MRKRIVDDGDEEMYGDDDDQEPEGDATENGGDDDDEDDDDEGPDEYEKDDFIVSDVEEEEDSDDERQKKKKRKKKRKEVDVELDDDDMEIVREANPGYQSQKESKQFKRLKKAQRDGDRFDGAGKSGQTAEEKLKYSLFGDDEGVPLEDIGEEDEQVEEEDDLDLGDDDEMADFIVDEEEVGDHRQRKLKKKKPRQGSGALSAALQEAHEIFGDVDELLQAREHLLKPREEKERRLEDEFEPAILSEKYMTDKDDKIRVTDIPERLKISQESTGSPPTDDSSLEEESSWIYEQLLSLYGKKKEEPALEDSVQEEQQRDEENINVQKKDELFIPINRNDIRKFLDLHHVHKLDIPFIAMYRKEQCPTILKNLDEQEDGADNGDESEKTCSLKWHKILWVIQDLNRKWLLLQKRKSALDTYYRKRFEEESRRIYDEVRLELNQQLFESVMKSLKDAESEREVDDVDSKFNLHFPPGEVGADEGQFKRPKRKSQYSVCSKAGLWEAASKFGCSAEQFGLSLSLDTMCFIMEDPKETPEEIASRFTCAMFQTPKDVLKGARHMTAVEISCEPSVRKFVRETYMSRAVVSTTPTSDGNVAVDTFHQFAGVKWLRDKPLSKFDDAQWLLIQKAEEEKLLQVTLKLPPPYLEKLNKEWEVYLISDGVSKCSKLWNEQRKMILDDVLSNFLLPSMEKEARSMMNTKAKNWLLMDYGKALWNKVSVAPYKRKENENSSDDNASPKVMACCWAPGKPATTFVMIDSSGEVIDVMYTASLTLRSQNVNDQQRKKNDQQRVLKFMTDHQPHVVVLGALNLYCTRLKDDIYEIIFKMVEENPRDVGHEMDELSIVRRAVALGRYLQNPLAMVATLCGPKREILSWKLNPLEDFLTPDEKFGIVEQVMVDATNQVGLDINLATGHEWLFAPLQFISGLGPRKAVSLQRSLVRAGAIYTRKDFLTVHGIGKKVFFNAVGFLRVRRTGLASSSSQYIDLLDDTRIHPESYSLALELAKAICGFDKGGGTNDDEDALEMAIEQLKDRPSLLRSFNLDLYIEKGPFENKMETLNDIRRELLQGFQDWRIPYKEPSQDEEFFMISGETDDTLAEGKIVQATIRRVQGNKAICGLESGLTGLLMKEDFSDDMDDETDLTEKVHEGDILTCKIKSIQKNRYQVFLLCKDSAMRNNRHQFVQNLDPYYHEDRSSLLCEQEKARKDKELSKRHFKSRMIVHPRFRNITAEEAIEYLADKEPGESIVRPSSRGPSFLTLTLKVYDGVYAHKDIVEGGKEHKDITSLLRIGKTLKIGEDTFEDLDEVMDRYIDPLVFRLKAMLNYRKFKKGTKVEIDELLRVEKAEYPMRIVYCFGISHEHPGTFILTYIRSSTPHHEYIGIYPKGFKYRKKMFEDVDRLVHFFQKHIDDPPPDPSQSIRSVAAIVPMRTGDGGGWGGSSDGGDWNSQSGRGGRDGGRGRGRGRGRGGRGRGRNNDNDFNNDAPNKSGGEADVGGWGGSKTDVGGSGGGWGGNKTDGGGWGGNKTGGSSDWGGNKSGGGGGNDWGGSKSGGETDVGGWGGSKTDVAGSGGGWGGNKTGGSSDWGGNKSGGGKDWGGSKSGGEADAGGWGGSKTDVGGSGGGWGGNKTGGSSDWGGNKSGGGGGNDWGGSKSGGETDVGGWGGSKTDVGGSGGGWGGNKTGGSSDWGGNKSGGGKDWGGSKSGGEADAGGWGGSKTDVGGSGGGWGGNKTGGNSDKAGNKNGGGGGNDWGGSKSGGEAGDVGGWGRNKTDAGGSGVGWGGTKTGGNSDWGGNKSGGGGSAWGGNKIAVGGGASDWGGNKTGGGSSDGGDWNSQSGRGGRDGGRGRGLGRGGRGRGRNNDNDFNNDVPKWDSGNQDGDSGGWSGNKSGGGDSGWGGIKTGGGGDSGWGGSKTGGGSDSAWGGSKSGGGGGNDWGGSKSGGEAGDVGGWGGKKTDGGGSGGGWGGNKTGGSSDWGGNKSAGGGGNDWGGSKSGGEAGDVGGWGGKKTDGGGSGGGWGGNKTGGSDWGGNKSGSGGGNDWGGNKIGGKANVGGWGGNKTDGGGSGGNKADGGGSGGGWGGNKTGGSSDWGGNKSGGGGGNDWGGSKSGGEADIGGWGGNKTDGGGSGGGWGGNKTGGSSDEGGNKNGRGGGNDWGGSKSGGEAGDVGGNKTDGGGSGGGWGGNKSGGGGGGSEEASKGWGGAGGSSSGGRSKGW
ncbi:hypothetical protein ACFE04_030757 [Oxalis oulophora]